MKMFIISDNTDTATGLRLAGVEGTVTKSREDTLAALEKAMEDKEIGIILITELLADLVPEAISYIKMNLSRPLIVEIPDRHGTRRPSDYLLNSVNKAVGVKLE